MTDVHDRAGMNRRQFIRTAGLGAAGLAVAASGIAGAESAEALMAQPGNSGLLTPGVQPPNAPRVAILPRYNGGYNRINSRPFGGFNFALGYIAEGVDTTDPLQPFPNPSGLFESVEPDIPSAVGGNETRERSAEFWYYDILNFTNETIANDFWSFINWARRMYGLDFDDPANDGYPLPDGTRYTYHGSPDPKDQKSLFQPRIAVDGKGGWARMAPTLLAPNVGYTVVLRAGRAHPNYSGGTTAVFPEDVGKVRDGGIWGGTVETLDVLDIIQQAARGERTYTTPSGSRSAPAQWGQWYRRIAPIDGTDIDALDPNMPIDKRPTPRPGWPAGVLPRGTDYFWGNYNLKWGRREETSTIHYQSEVPTRFRDFDGIPEAFICDIMPNPGAADSTKFDFDMGFADRDGSLSGFADFSDPKLNDQAPFGYGRVHGTSYPRGKDAKGRTTFHLRNWLLFPPRLNAVNNINTSVPGKGVLADI